MSKLSGLLERDLKIVEKRKFIFLIPVCFLVLAIIMGVIFGFTTGSPLNLGMDFAGGYTINVNVGANLTSANADEYKARITDIVENYADEDGKKYNIKVSQILEAGEDNNKALQVKFKSVIDDDDTMDAIVEGIVAKINENVTVIRPSKSRDGNKVTLVYNLPLKSLKSELESKFAKIDGATNLQIGDAVKDSAGNVSSNVTLDYNFSSLSEDQINEKLNEIASAMEIKDTFSATIYSSGKVGATVSQDLLYNAISAILIALVLMLIYIGIRFEFKSGISAIVALVHDLMVMFAFMIIFHVEFNSTFIAALITILGYSINNSIILFDRVRSNLKMNKNMDKYELADMSIRQSFIRCMNTTITTVIMIGCVALVCAIASIFNPDLYQMVTFSLPIIVGLLSGFYSAMFVAPSVWVSLGDFTKRGGKAQLEKAPAGVAKKVEATSKAEVIKKAVVAESAAESTAEAENAATVENAAVTEPVAADNAAATELATVTEPVTEAENASTEPATAAENVQVTENTAATENAATENTATAEPATATTELATEPATVAENTAAENAVVTENVATEPAAATENTATAEPATVTESAEATAEATKEAAAEENK